jgi:UDP:flavonoid glycosyltransferase YjiC (YdhE family)
MGGGFGHFFRLTSLALELKRLGCEVFWAIPGQNRVEGFLRQANFTVCHTPDWEFPELTATLSHNFAENLLKNGYGYPESLKRQLGAWVDLLEEVNPDVLVAEYAPTALLAAQVKNIPALAIGTGFTVPPARSPMPGLQPWFDLPDRILCRKEAAFLEIVNPVLKDAGVLPLLSVSDIFREAEPLLCTIPEFDHYGPRTDMPYQGPVFSSSREMLPTWPSEGDENIFVYLPLHNRSCLPVIEWIKNRNLPAVACVPGLSEFVCRSLSAKHLRVSPHPFNLDNIEKHCCLAICEGGHNTGALMLLRGVPLLLCPRHLEQAIWSYRISGQGLGVMIGFFDRTPDYEKKCAEILYSGTIRGQVRALAKKYEHLDSGITVQHLAEKCLQKRIFHAS